MRRKRLNQSINILQINICGGLLKKKTELAKLFKQERIHVAMLQEARHKNVNYDITGCTAYPCDCKECLGIITYIRNDTIGDVISIPIAHPTDVQEIIIWHAETKYTLFIVYSPPKFECKLPNLQDPIYYKNHYMGIFGPQQNWNFC